MKINSVLHQGGGFGGITLVGNGGHAQVIRDLLHHNIQSLSEEFCIVAIGDNRTRKKVVDTEIAQRLIGKPYKSYVFPVLIHKKACVSDSAEIGEGTVVMAGAIVQAHAKIGKHCIINTGATVDHDCVIGDYAHIAPGAHLCGGVEVGEGALVGVGSCAPPLSVIEAWTLLKAGTVAKRKRKSSAELEIENKQLRDQLRAIIRPVDYGMQPKKQ